MARENEVIVSDPIEDSGVELLREYWTPDAMAEAEPIFVDVDEAAVQLLEERAWTAEGDQVEQRSVAPEGAASLEWVPQPTCPATGSNTQRVGDRGVIPYSAVGKLYMTFGDKNYVGSAWTIAGSGVFTAGHCVFDRDTGWAKRVLFVPQFNGGQKPVGEWSAIQFASLKGWTEQRDFRYDLACFKTNRPIQPATGSLGWMANFAPNQGPYTGIGYPAAAPYDGSAMWSSTGNYRGGSNPIQAWNDMTGGCSGGPWSVWKNGVPYANGLNSFRYTSDPASLYSPYFGNDFLALYNWVK